MARARSSGSAPAGRSPRADIGDYTASHLSNDFSTNIQDDYVVSSDEFEVPAKSEDKVPLPLLEEEFINIENVTLQGPKAKFPSAIDSTLIWFVCLQYYPIAPMTNNLPPRLIALHTSSKLAEKDYLRTLKFNSMNAVMVCKKEDRVFVVFTGTQSHTDTASDLAFLPRTMNLPNKERKLAHSGFVKRSEEFSLWVNSALSNIEGIGQMEIISTGHSLGGGLATLLAHASILD